MFIYRKECCRDGNSGAEVTVVIYRYGRLFSDSDVTLCDFKFPSRSCSGKNIVEIATITQAISTTDGYY